MLILCLLVTASFSGYASAALGLTPALAEVNYEPGLNFSVGFSVVGADADQRIKVYADGDFNDSVTFDKTEIKGREGFTANIILPDSAPKPGKNRLYIRVSEIKDENSGLGYRLDVGALIAIYVPYPGKYAEITAFSANDVNEAEPLNFFLEVSNSGKEDLFVSADVELSSENQSTRSVSLGSRYMASQTKEKFEKSFDTNGMQPGIYNAKAIVKYDINSTSAEKEVKIGTMFVRINNWSSEVEVGKIDKFQIEIESLWNSKIENINAGVNVTQGSNFIGYFRTPSVSLNAWKKDVLEGFFDAEKVKPGVYNANITLFYGNKTSDKVVSFSVVKKSSVPWILIIGIAVAVLIIGIVVYIYVKKKKSKKRK